jgi:hypothetical protein
MNLSAADANEPPRGKRESKIWRGIKPDIAE